MTVDQLLGTLVAVYIKYILYLTSDPIVPSSTGHGAHSTRYSTRWVTTSVKDEQRHERRNMRTLQDVEDRRRTRRTERNENQESNNKRARRA